MLIEFKRDVFGKPHDDIKNYCACHRSAYDYKTYNKYVVSCEFINEALGGAYVTLMFSSGLATLGLITSLAMFGALDPIVSGGNAIMYGDQIVSSSILITSSLFNFHEGNHSFAAVLFATGATVAYLVPTIGVPLMGVGIAYELYHNMYGVEQI